MGLGLGSFPPTTLVLGPSLFLSEVGSSESCLLVLLVDWLPGRGRAQDMDVGPGGQQEALAPVEAVPWGRVSGPYMGLSVPDLTL